MSQEPAAPSRAIEALFKSGGEVAGLIQRKDWAATPLGPVEGWPQSLRSAVRIMLTSRYSMWMGWGEELTFLYNDAYAKATLGAKHPWALGRPFREVWAEIWDQLAPRIDRVMRGGEATWDEGLLLFLERSGYREETYHTFSYSPLLDDDGAVVGNFCVVMEETERLIAERRLALLRDLAAALALASTEGDVSRAVEGSIRGEPRDLPFSLLYVFDTDDRARLVAATGFATAPKAGIDLTDPLAPWGLQAIAAGSAVQTVDCAGVVTGLSEGPWSRPPAQALVLPITQQGQSRPTAAFVAGLNPYRPLDETYRSFVGLFVGQVAAGLANARAYEAERHRAEALAAIDRAKTAFFSNVSHEFRTPLTLMLGPTEDALAGDGTLDRGQLETVYRNELRLLKLVNSLLDFSRAEAGRMQAVYEPTDLAALTADLASTFRSAIERGGLTFEVDCQPLDQPVHVDRQMWEKIVLNLLSNAFKFTLEGRIRVTLRGEAGAAVLTVADSGVGIPEQELPRVFERFHRIEGTRARTHEGSGIGLALVHDLVKFHGGEISVGSEPTQGTRFSIRIPTGIDHLPQDRITAVRPAEGSGSISQAFLVEAQRWLDPPPTSDETPHPPGHTRERARIVLADDNADMRDYVGRLLGERWAIESVGNGHQALAAVRRDPPDLIISDVMMPELDGFGLLAALRASDDTRDIPVLLLSARAGEEARLEGLHAGADDYLVKPFSARELLARVETQLLRASMHAVENLQRRQLADIFRQAPAAIAILRGPEHTFDHANPAYLDLIGRRDVLGKPIREALPELGGQGIYELLDNVYTSGEPYVGKTVRVAVLREPGEPAVDMYFDFVYQPMRDATGAVDGIAVVCFDVSELARARQDAEMANRAKDEFLAMLGHELRNPLAPMLTALQLMRLRGGDALQRERTVIERQTQHLVRLVDDLLDVSRIARGKIELRRERMDLMDAVVKAIEMASPLLEERNHDLAMAVPRGLAIDADPSRLAQIIANLLTNAAKYTEADGRIEVDGFAEGAEVVLRVRDTGIGIAPEMLPRVFDMFTQERQALDRTQGGLGLGLTIVRNLTALHGGSVVARSEGRGKGSEFVVRLPAAVTETPAVGAGERAPDVASARAPIDVPILIVDDNEDAAEMLAEYVKTIGFAPRAVHDGPSALREAGEFLPRIALLDIGLPVMDGYELASRLREQPALHGIKLIAVTGYGQEADRDRSRAAGFDAHLVKPVNLDRLQDLLEQLAAPQP